MIVANGDGDLLLRLAQSLLASLDADDGGVDDELDEYDEELLLLLLRDRVLVLIVGALPPFEPSGNVANVQYEPSDSPSR